MPIDVTCPGCRKRFRLKDQHAGKRLNCPDCGTALKVPRPADGHPGIPAQPSPDRLPPLPGKPRRDEAPTGKKGTKKKKPRRAPSRWPLIAGLTAAVFVGISGLATLLFWLWPGGASVADLPVVDGEPIPGWSEEPPREIGLPRGVKQPPAWVSAGPPPFDIREFWVTVPDDQNAASQYLDALYEISPEVEVCIPAPLRGDRTRIATERSQRQFQIEQSLYDPRMQFDPAERDRLLEDMEVVFKKIREAQQRPLAIFDYPHDIPGLTPLVGSARQFGRLADLSIRRDVERQNFEGAAATLESVLRFSRDLRRRAPMIMQYIADSIETFLMTSSVTPSSLTTLLQSPHVSPADCDRLLRILTQHEAELEQIDRFTTGLQGSFLMDGSIFHELKQRTGPFSEGSFPTAFGMQHTHRISVLAAAYSGTEIMMDTKKHGAERIQAAGTFLDALPPQQYDAYWNWLSDSYRKLSAGRKEKYRQRQEVSEAIEKQGHVAVMLELTSEFGDSLNQAEDQVRNAKITDSVVRRLKAGTFRSPLLTLLMFGRLESDYGGGAVVETDVSVWTRLQASRLLIALRRWCATHAEPPPDMATLCREAGIAAIPRDHFSFAEFRLATFDVETPILNHWNGQERILAGETVIYSIGPDEVDDRALKEVRWMYNTNPGDIVFRLEIPQNVLRQRASVP